MKKEYSMPAVKIVVLGKVVSLLGLSNLPGDDEGLGDEGFIPIPWGGEGFFDFRKDNGVPLQVLPTE